METKKTLSDYCPLYLDFPEPENTREFSIESAEALVFMAIERQFTPFQCAVLLLKNTFEGHVNLMKDLTPVNVCERGTYVVDLAQGTSLSLVHDFYESLFLYREGLDHGWNKMVEGYGIHQDVCYDSLLHYLLANQMFKMPVLALEGYDMLEFQGLTENQRKYFLRQYQLAVVISQFQGDYHLINLVKMLYETRFREIILKINSKEDVLSQLDAKLLMANSPEIRSEQELERKYFEFLVARRMKEDVNRTSANIPEFKAEEGGRVSQQLIQFRLKQVYRAIAKNCRETHTSMGSDRSYPELKELFIEASSIYNEIRPEECDSYIHNHLLMEILHQTLLFRRRCGLPASVIDFTGLKSRYPLARTSGEFIEKTRLKLADRTSSMKSLDHTAFKIKNVCDEELAILHQDFLEKQNDFLDERIREMLEQIKSCIANKGVSY